MINIEIYSKSYCPFCKRAKALLHSKGLTFNEYEIIGDDEKRREMISRSGGSTVPQIFINDLHIGGAQDLEKAEASGELDQILAYITNTTKVA